MTIGAKIRSLRVQNGLTLEELAARSELTKGFLSQVERDLSSPSIATLIDILECLGTDLAHFFSEGQEEKIVFQQEDVFVQEEKNGSYTIEWIVPNAQKNEMEPIMITLKPGAESERYCPHSGEEFGYVLNGSVVLHLGNKKYRCKKGEAFSFKPETEHYLANASKQKEAKILWISNPPSF